MEFGLGSYSFGLLAGLLSTLSPCVLPIIPILLGSAANVQPRAPLALAGGLALSYAATGTALAWAASSLGLDTAVFRTIGAILLGILGVVLMSGSLQQRFASAAGSGIGDAGHRLIRRMSLDGLCGQFAIGLVLGIVWSPCVGPTLGSAIVLAGQGAHLWQVALLMGIFGIGAALPIVILARLSRSAIAKARGKLLQAGKAGKTGLGFALLVVAVLVLSGADKPIESWLVDNSPQWLTNLTTRY